MAGIKKQGGKGKDKTIKVAEKLNEPPCTFARMGLSIEIQKKIKDTSLARSPLVHLDLSMTSCSDSRARKSIEGELIRLTTTHFFEFEVERLLHIYWKLTRNTKMTSIEFKLFLYNVFGMSNTYAAKLIFMAFEEKMLSEPKGSISPSKFVQILSIFCRGTLVEKIQFAFTVYDYNKLDELDEKTCINLIKKTFVNEGLDRKGKVIFDPKEYFLIVLNRFDPRGTGKVTFEDFSEAVLEQPGLLEAFGQIFPDRVSIYAFLTTFTPFVSTFHVESVESVQKLRETMSAIERKTEVKEEEEKKEGRKKLYVRDYDKQHLDELFAETESEISETRLQQTLETEIVTEESIVDLEFKQLPSTVPEEESFGEEFSRVDGNLPSDTVSASEE